MDIYDKREIEILEKMKQGRSREDIAKDYDYSNYRSLDMFLKRRGYVWNSKNQEYEPEVTNTDNIRDELISGISIKAEQIVNRIGEGQDIREISKTLGFSDHREMADYMEKEGLTWDSELGNYIDMDGEVSNAIVSKDDLKLNTDDPKASLELKSTNIDSNTLINLDGMEKYIPMLELLYENRDKLSELLLSDDKENVPRYIVPGAAKTKSIYMNDKLARLMADFVSNNGSISQREVVETSIILYLKKYGGSYSKDVEMLLNKK